MPGSISNSALLSRKLRFGIALIGIIAMSGILHAQKSKAWTSRGVVLPDGLTEQLMSRFPDLSQASDREGLLREVARRMPLMWLQIKEENGQYVLEGASAARINDFEFSVPTRALAGQLEALTQPYIGQVDSDEMHARIIGTIKAQLTRKGYPSAEVRLAVEPDDEGVIYGLSVDQGSPCIISSLEVALDLPKGDTLSVAPGDVCDVEEITGSIDKVTDKLKKDGYTQVRIELTNVAYKSDTNTATVYIGGVLGQRIRYEIVDKSKRFLIDDLFTSDELSKVDPTIVGPDAMGAELTKRYQNRGFADVVVSEPQVKKTGPDEFNYIFEIDPGPQYSISNIQFDGVTQFSRGELLDMIGLGSLWQSTSFFNQDEINRGLETLRAKYQERGYWDALVKDPRVAKDKESKTISISVIVTEGLPHIFRKVEITGNHAIETDRILELIKNGKDDAIDRAELLKDEQKIRELYAVDGYLYTSVKIALTEIKGSKNIATDVHIAIEERARVKVGEISISGLNRTRSKVVMRELLFKTGDWYSPEALDFSRKALSKLGLFSSVQIVPAEKNALSDQLDTIDLMIEVREGKAGSMSYGPGWRYYSGWLYNTEASYNNIGGVNRQASFRAAISEQKQQQAISSRTLVGRKISAGYLEPYIFELPIDLSVSATTRAVAAPYYRLWELSNAGETALIHRLRVLIPGATISPFYGQKINREEGVPEQKEDIIASNIRIGRTGLRFDIDRRNDLAWPTRGYTLATETSWAFFALGGDLHYFRWQVDNNYFYGLTENLVAAVSFSFAAFSNIEKNENSNSRHVLPPTERLQAGGGESVRGFRERTLGPVPYNPQRNSGDQIYLGGTRRAVVKTEMRYQIIKSTLATTGFIDSGNTFLTKGEEEEFNAVYADNAAGKPAGSNMASKVEDNYPYEFSDLVTNPGYLWSKNYVSYGFAFNVLTPIGAINLAYGIPWHEPCDNSRTQCMPRSIENAPWFKRGQFHINVGAEF